MILDDLLVLIDGDESLYPILTIYKNRAITLVLKYLNSSVYDATYIEDNFADAIIELVYNAYSVKGKEDIQSESQGSRNVTYKITTTFADGATNAITNSIRALLPLPKVRMMG